MLMSFTLFKILNEHVFDFDDDNNDSSGQSWTWTLDSQFQLRHLNHAAMAMLPPSDIMFWIRKTQKTIAEQHFISHELVIYFNYRW